MRLSDTAAKSSSPMLTEYLCMAAGEWLGWQQPAGGLTRRGGCRFAAGLALSHPHSRSAAVVALAALLHNFKVGGGRAIAAVGCR